MLGEGSGEEGCPWEVPGEPPKLGREGDRPWGEALGIMGEIGLALGDGAGDWDAAEFEADGAHGNIFGDRCWVITPKILCPTTPLPSPPSIVDWYL